MEPSESGEAREDPKRAAERRAASAAGESVPRVVWDEAESARHVLQGVWLREQVVVVREDEQLGEGRGRKAHELRGCGR